MGSAGPSEKEVPSARSGKRLAGFVRLAPLAASLMLFSLAGGARAADNAQKFTEGTEVTVRAENYLARNHRASNGDITARKGLTQFENGSGEAIGIGVGIGAVKRDIGVKDAAAGLSGSGGYDSGKVSLFVGAFSGDFNAALAVEETAVLGVSYEGVSEGSSSSGRSSRFGFARTSARLRAGEGFLLEGSYDRHDSRLDLHMNGLDLLSDACSLDIDGGYADLGFRGGSVTQRMRRLSGSGLVTYRKITDTDVSVGLGGYYSGVKSESSVRSSSGWTPERVDRDLGGPIMGLSYRNIRLRGGYLFGSERAGGTEMSRPGKRAGFAELVIVDVLRAGAVIGKRMEEADLSLALKF